MNIEVYRSNTAKEKWHENTEQIKQDKISP